MEWLSHLADILGRVTLRQVIDPSSRMFMPYLVVALALALVVMVMEQGKKLSPAERLLSRETWLSRSAINDYGLIMMNALLVATLLWPFLLNDQLITRWLVAQMPSFGAEPSFWAPVALALTLFLVNDFARFVTHYLEHRIPALWELHKVHHSAEVLNFTTAERHHPLSLIWFRMVEGSMAAMVNALFLILFAHKFTMATLLGGNLFWVISNMAGGTLRHSPVWISFGPRIERWFISPAQHQIHHSTNPAHFDRNFGSTLAIWDRMFGSLYVTSRERERIEYGLGDETPAYRSLFALYARPVRRLFRR
jgi:sterol desaturase/sphingolipid hydroxylase (fatty acid hydroxylase superfamily)